MPEGPTPLPLIQCNPGDEPRYYWNENKPKLKYASVTAILSATQSKETKTALKRWQNKIKEEGGDPKDTLIAAAKRGSDIHNWIEPWLLKRNPTIPVEIYPWCQRIKEAPIWNFIDYVIRTEMKVCSDQGIIPFAGTFDALFKIGDETVLFDLKTKGEGKGQPSKSICDEALCQMQAYRVCLKENHAVDVDRLIALYVFPDQPAFPVFAAGDDLLYHEKQWDKRLQQYADQQS
jgi:hypothetical protein